MAGIRKRSWRTKDGKIKTCYEITYYLDGKQYRKSGFKTKLEAQESLSTVTKTYTSNITLKELADKYINCHCTLRCKDSTINLYNGYLKNNLKSLLHKKAKDVKKVDFDRLFLSWKQQEMSNKTINDILGLVRSFYNYGIKNKWLSENPAKEIDKLPKTTKEIKFLNEEQIKQFVSIIEKYPKVKYLALLTDIYTGLRISELLALEWSDIDFKNNTISVNRQYYKGNVQTPKTLKSIRKIQIPQFLTDKLKDLRQTNVLSKIVFCSKTGGYISQDKFVETYFKRAMKKIGLEDFNFHCLRHTYATFLLSNGIPLKYVQEQLGHSTPTTTLNTYNHVMPSVNSDAQNLLKKLQCEQNMSIDDMDTPETQSA